MYECALERWDNMRVQLNKVGKHWATIASAAATEAEAETKAFPQVVRTTNSSAAAATVEVGVKVEIAAAEAASPQSRLWSRQPDLARPVNSCRITSS